MLRSHIRSVDMSGYMYAEGRYMYPAQTLGNLSTGESRDQAMTVRSAGSTPGEKRQRKKRLRLSCGECNKKKVLSAVTLVCC